MLLLRNMIHSSHCFTFVLSVPRDNNGNTVLKSLKNLITAPGSCHGILFALYVDCWMLIHCLRDSFNYFVMYVHLHGDNPQLERPRVVSARRALVLFSLLRIESCAVRRFEARVQKM